MFVVWFGDRECPEWEGWICTTCSTLEPLGRAECDGDDSAKSSDLTDVYFGAVRALWCVLRSCCRVDCGRSSCLGPVLWAGRRCPADYGPVLYAKKYRVQTKMLIMTRRMVIISSSSRRKIGLRAGERRESCSVRTYRPTPERFNLDRPVERGRGRQSPHSTSRSRSIVDVVAVELKGLLSGA